MILEYAKLIAVIVIWGGNYHVVKYLVSEADIFTIGLLRFIISSLLLLLLYFRKNRRAGFQNKLKQYWKILFLIGLIGVFLYNLLFFGASQLIAANRVAVFYAFTPAVTVLLGVVFLKHYVNFFGYLGVIIALLGTIGVIIVSINSVDVSGTTNSINQLLFGQILAILAALAMAIYNILNKKALQHGLDSLTITTFGAVFATAFLFITVILFGKTSLSDLASKTWLFWVAMIYLSVLATVLCYKWYSDAIHKIGVGKTVVFQNGVPLSAVLIGILLLGEQMLFGVLISGAVIIVGVLITNLAISNR
jgi:drug/metabolite transporter (DMT)-like permease